MKFTCTKDNLDRGLQLISHIAKRSSHLPILQNVLLRATDSGIELVVTNLEIGLRVSLRGKVETPGEFTVPAQVLASYIHLLQSDQVDVVLDSGQLKITAAGQSTRMNGDSSADFPLIPVVEKTTPITLSALELKTAIAQTVVAAATDDARPELTTVLFALSGDTLTLAATDSYRLAESVVKLGQDCPKTTMLIPAAAAHEMVRVLPESDEMVQLYCSDTQALLLVGDIEFTTRLIDGVFPNYTQIIPTDHQTTTIASRHELMHALKTASLFSKSGIHDVSIDFDSENKSVTLSSVNAQVGDNRSLVTAQITGASTAVIFNYRYLLDGLQMIKGDLVRLSVTDAMSPGLLVPEGQIGYRYVIMPIKQ